MARRQVFVNEILEMIYQWDQGAGFKAIRRSLGFDRKTVRKYIRLAQAAGVQRGSPLPEEGELVNRLKELQAPALLRQTPGQDQIAPYRQWVDGLLRESEPKGEEITAKQIWRLFREKTGLLIGYGTMKRYLRTQFQWGSPPVTVRLEVEPGTQAQVDFGSVGMMVDPVTGQPRRAWAFIMTLSYSRHRFVHFVFRQDVDRHLD